MAKVTVLKLITKLIVQQQVVSTVVMMSLTGLHTLQTVVFLQTIFVMVGMIV